MVDTNYIENIYIKVIAMQCQFSNGFSENKSEGCGDFVNRMFAQKISLHGTV